MAKKSSSYSTNKVLSRQSAGISMVAKDDGDKNFENVLIWLVLGLTMHCHGSDALARDIG
jgi:hypothetical protein